MGVTPGHLPELFYESFPAAAIQVAVNNTSADKASGQEADPGSKPPEDDVSGPERNA